MATKATTNLSMIIDVTPYEHEGNHFNALDVTVSYAKGIGFVVCYQPVMKGKSVFSFIRVGDRSPLTSMQRVHIKDSVRNSTKELKIMQQNLSDFKDGIAYLFDKRDWDRLNSALKNVSLHGYTDAFRKQMEEYTDKHSSVAPSSPVKDTDSRVAYAKQYREYKAKNPDTLLLFRCGEFYEIYNEDAKVAADVLGLTLTEDNGMIKVGFPHHEIDTYLPKLIRAGKRVAICDQLEAPKGNYTNRKETKTESKHHQITSNNETNMVTINMKESKSVQPTQVEDNEQVVSMGNDLPEVKFATYTTKKGAAAPQIIGFGGEEDPRWKHIYDEKPKWVSASWYKDVTGVKAYRLIFGVRYMEVAKALTEAYNTGDREAWKHAEQECEATYHQAQADGKARWEAKKQEWDNKRSEREIKNTKNAIAGQSNVKTFTEQEVAVLMQRVMEGDKEVLEQVNAIMQKVA